MLIFLQEVTNYFEKKVPFIKSETCTGQAHDGNPTFFSPSEIGNLVCTGGATLTAVARQVIRTMYTENIVSTHIHLCYEEGCLNQATAR